MRKKVYQLTLDRESAEIVRDWLRKTNGLSLSAYLTGVLKELAIHIQGQPTPMSKSPKEMTVPEFIQAMQYWVNVAGEESEK